LHLSYFFLITKTNKNKQKQTKTNKNKQRDFKLNILTHENPRESKTLYFSLITMIILSGMMLSMIVTFKNTNYHRFNSDNVIDTNFPTEAKCSTFLNESSNQFEIENTLKNLPEKTSNDGKNSAMSAKLVKPATLISGPIVIDNNWSAVATLYSWCTGTGTAVDPYFIELISVDAQQAKNGINISNSNDYFLISKIIVTNFYDSGLLIKNTTNGQIVNSTFSDYNDIGIYLSTCNNITIKENIFIENYIGIVMDNSKNINIEENFFENNFRYAIYLYFSRDTVLKKNAMFNCGIGFWVSKAQSTSHIIGTDNMVNYRPVVYIVNQTNANVPVNAGQIVLANTNSTTVENFQHYTILNLIYASLNIIQDNIILDSQIILLLSHNNTIQNNIGKNIYSAIYLDYSNHNMIRNNTFANIYFYSIVLYRADENSIINNDLTRIKLQLSDKNLISNNKIDPYYSSHECIDEINCTGNNFTNNECIESSSNDMWSGKFTFYWILMMFPIFGSMIGGVIWALKQTSFSGKGPVKNKLRYLRGEKGVSPLANQIYQEYHTLIYPNFYNLSRPSGIWKWLIGIMVYVAVGLFIQWSRYGIFESDQTTIEAAFVFTILTIIFMIMWWKHRDKENIKEFPIKIGAKTYYGFKKRLMLEERRILKLNNKKIINIFEMNGLSDSLNSDESLYALDLSYNNLSDLSGFEKLNLEELRILNLSHNKLTNLESILQANLPKLELLILSYNNLEDPWATKILSKSMPSLWFLDFSYNKFQNIQNTNLKNNNNAGNNYNQVEICDFTNNQISNCDLPQLPNLTVLDLTLNCLFEFPSFSTCPALQFLWLWKNQIQNIAKISTCEQLSYVDLRNNLIENIDSALELTSLFGINIKINPVFQQRKKIFNKEWSYCFPIYYRKSFLKDRSDMLRSSMSDMRKMKNATKAELLAMKEAKMLEKEQKKRILNGDETKIKEIPYKKDE
jgi:parallel beta-helix repeat protein